MSLSNADSTFSVKKYPLCQSVYQDMIYTAQKKIHYY